MTRLLKLLEQEPNDAFCLYSIAQEHAKRNDHSSAIEYYNRTIDADPDYLYAYFHKARSAQAMGSIERARQALMSGLERAGAVGDAKALSELSALLDELA